jgi:FeS assembly SUF system regulator
MLRISKLADYATVILNCLALNKDCLLSSQEIAKRVHIGWPTVSKILKIAQESGLVVSTRGAIGGYSLSKAPEEITLAQSLMALEGPVALTECSNPGQLCVQDTTCSIKHNWRAINQFFLATLEKVTLADMSQTLKLDTVTMQRKKIPCL